MEDSKISSRGAVRVIVQTPSGNDLLELGNDFDSVGEVVCQSYLYLDDMRASTALQLDNAMGTLDDRLSCEDDELIGSSLLKRLNMAKELAAQRDSGSSHAQSKNEPHYKMIRLLTNAEGVFLFSNDKQALRLLATAYTELGRYQEFFALCWKCVDFLLSDHELLQKYLIITYESQGDEEFITTFKKVFTGGNLRDKDILAISGYFNEGHMYKPLAAIGDLVRQSAVIEHNTMRAFYGRALNGTGRPEETIALFAAKNDADPLRMNPEYSRSVECIKALAYALRDLSRIKDAKSIIQDAIRAGVPRNELMKISMKVGVDGEGGHKQSRS